MKMHRLSWCLSLALVALPAAAQEQERIAGDAYWGNTGGSSFEPLENPPASVDEVLSESVLSDRRSEQAEIPWVRAQAIQEAAAAYGAQAGLASRARQINQSLLQDQAHYDRVFNFAMVMLEPGFLPPVISEGRDAYNQPSDNEVRASDRLYRIEFPARLVNVPPRWQDYLFIPEAAAMPPDRTALPKDDAERQVWDHWARQGWERGVGLAEETFRSNLGRLRRDYEGMLRFKTLYAQGLVTRPVLATSNLGVTGGDDEMAINDRVYEITDRARLNPDHSRWSAPMPRTHVNDPAPREVPPAE